MEKFVTVEGKAWKLYGDGSKDKPFNIGVTKYNQDLIEDIFNEPGFKDSYFVWGSTIYQAMKVVDLHNGETQSFSVSHTGRTVRLWREGIEEEKIGNFSQSDIMKSARDSVELVKALTALGIETEKIEFLIG